MPTIQDMVNQAIKQWGPEVPMRKCDVCNLVRRQDCMINFTLVVGSPGHPDLPCIQCPHTEHWACSIAHFQDIINQCALVELVNIVAHMHSVILPLQGITSVYYEEATDHLKNQGITDVNSDNTVSSTHTT